MALNGVGKTGLLVAAMRALESRRKESEGRLIVDPFAERLAGEEGFALAKQAIQEVGENPVIAFRTRYIDDHFQKALDTGVRQIVILAAGMDSRAYRCTFPEGTSLFEVDRPEVLSYKQKKMHNIKPQCERKAVAVDLRDDWSEPLLRAGMNPQKPTLWLVEGLLMYLEANVVELLFDQINKLSVAKSLMLFDILGNSLLSAPYMIPQLKFLENLGAPWLFGTDHPEKLLTAIGWSSLLTQPGEVCPDRWPFPIAPLHIPNVPRSFFVEAQKN